MVSNFTRIDTLELKDLIYQKIGHQRADNYFDQLSRFLNLKLSKAEFDKSCIQTIGRENISLHNRLIRSIAQNACQASTPPRKAQKVGLNVKVSNGYQKNCLQSLYGDAFPQSPHKCRSPVSRKFRDRPSPLGPLGKSPSLTCEDTVTRTQEQQSATELQDGEEVEQCSESLSLRRWSHVTAPLGVSVNRVVPRKDFIFGYKDDACGESCESRGELPDTASLRRRLQKKLAPVGVGLTLECAEAINKGLDVFLKRLLEPCVSIASSKSRQSNKAEVSELNGKLAPRFGERSSQSTGVSLLDFQVAVESNPRLLGPDWPVQLEKICHYASEE